MLPHPTDPILAVGGTVSEDSVSPLVTVELWAIDSGRLLGRCCGTRYQISDVHMTLLPGGTEVVVVAGGLDSTVRMWKVSPDIFQIPSCGDDDDLGGTDDLDEDEEIDHLRPLTRQNSAT